MRDYLPPPATSLRGRRVAIVGAGLAGLTAAWALERRGAETRVFEARRRIGGRVLTIRNLAGAAHAEMGGEIIESENREAIGAVVEELGLALTPILPGGFKYYTAASPRGGAVQNGSRMFSTLRERLAKEIAAYTRAEKMLTSGAVRALGAISARAWAESQPSSRSLAGIVESLRGFLVAEPSEYSLLMLVAVLAEGGDPASVKMLRVAGGNDRLPQALADSLRRTPDLGCRVLRVARRRMRTGVAVTTERNGRRHTFDCDAVVVAVPATLAREIEFDPPLPGDQWRAIRTLPYGRATKAAVSFDRRFWRRRGRAFGTRLPVGAVWESGAKDAAGTLACLGGGDASPSLARLVAEGTERDWRRELRWLGIGDARVTETTAITWEADPWARGAYACLSPAFDPSLVPWLSRPSGRIAFAGEHTSIGNQGYMEGAVASGLRAADDIESVLRRKNSLVFGL